MSRLAALGIKQSVVSAGQALSSAPASSTPSAASTPRRRRRLASPSSFPKGKGVTSSLAEDLTSAINVKMVAETLPSSGGPLTALQKRMQKSTKEILMITEDAAAVIKSLLERRDDRPLGVRVGVQMKGCNGLGYTMDYLYPEYLEQSEGSTTVRMGPSSTTQHGVTVYVEPDAFMHLVGTVMDYQVDKAAEKFVFLNPNSEGSCGCGESFVSKAAPTPHQRAAQA